MLEFLIKLTGKKADLRRTHCTSARDSEQSAIKNSVNIWHIAKHCVSLHSQTRKDDHSLHGEMAEWSNAPVLKTGVLQGTGGSNPSLSAKISVTSCTTSYADFLFIYIGQITDFFKGTAVNDSCTSRQSI